MTEHQKDGNPKHPEFDRMTDEELEQLLREDAEKPVEETDVEMLLSVMEVLAVRKRSSGGIGKTPEEAFRSFQHGYLPEDSGSTKTTSCWLRRLTAAAAVLAVVLFGSLTAKAFGFDIIGAVVRWTEDTFYMESAGEAADDTARVRRSFREVLDDSGISGARIPTWIPEGYQLNDVLINETPMVSTYLAMYHGEGCEFRIQVKTHLDEDPQQFESDGKLEETYVSGGIEYYIYRNTDRMGAAWLVEGMQYHVYGDLTMEQLKTMIDSIEE